jgi:hypothetical protein
LLKSRRFALKTDTRRAWDLRGKRSLRKLEAVSTDKEHVYECDACVWMVTVSPERSFGEIQAEFEEHDCSENSLKKKPIGYKA